MHNFLNSSMTPSRLVPYDTVHLSHRLISFPEYGVELTAGSITAHRQRMYGKEPAIEWSRLPVSQTEHQPQVYDVRFP